jgi:hypothetical protein
VHQLVIGSATTKISPRDWHFLVAGHQCNTTDLLSFPLEPKAPTVVK